jgi:hypothetical protein
VAHARRSSASRRKALPLRERALVIDSLADAVIALDSDGRIVLANDAVEGLLGYAAREITGRGLCDLLASDESVPTASGVVVRARHREGHDVSVALSFGHALVVKNNRHLLAIVLRPAAPPAASDAETEAARRRACLLAEASRIFAASRGLSALQALARAMASAYAGTCVIDLGRPDGGLRRVASAQGTDDVLPRAEELAPGIAETLRTARLHVEARATEHGGGFVVNAALYTDGHTEGVLTCVTTASISEADLAVADELARQAARSLVQARQLATALARIGSGLVTLAKRRPVLAGRTGPALGSC